RKAPFPGVLKFRLPPATFIRPAQRPASSIHQPERNLSGCSPWRGRSARFLSFENLPVVVIDEFNALRQKSNTKNNGAHESGEWRWANDIDEQTIARLIGFVGGIVQKRIVEYEQLVIAPIVDRIPNLDVGGAVFHVVKIVQDAQRGAQVSKMLRSGDLFIEHRNPDRLN